MCAQQALCINVSEVLNDFGIYAMFHDLLREAGESVSCRVLRLVGWVFFCESRARLHKDMRGLFPLSVTTVVTLVTRVVFVSHTCIVLY